MDGVAKKMVFRHPHVFGAVRAEDSEQALDTWDAQKPGRRSPSAPPPDTLEAVAPLPRPDPGGEGQSKAAKGRALTGRTGSPPWTSWPRRWTEFRRAAHGDGDPEEELGDLLFAAVRRGVSWGWTASRPSHRPVTNSSAGSGRWRSWRPVL